MIKTIIYFLSVLILKGDCNTKNVPNNDGYTPSHFHNGGGVDTYDGDDYSGDATYDGDDNSGDSPLFNMSNFFNNDDPKIETRLNDMLEDENRYQTTILPVKDPNTPVYLKIGLNLKSIEYFDQVNENIYLNMDLIQSWKDEYLGWNLTEFPTKYINLDSDKIWKPDLELYNAAKKPDLFNKISNVKLYHTGRIEWIRAIIYSFACPLELQNFPFDTQTCSMTFGSWKLDTRYLNIKPFNSSNKFEEFSIVDDFSHNEWELVNVTTSHNDFEYQCCKDILWSVSSFEIHLKRKFSSYINNIIMIAVLTLSGIIISLFDASLYRRTFVLVFIPLSIIWIQIDIADKIPVIEYSTVLEKYYMLCFAITNMLAIESGLAYALLTFKFIPDNTVEQLKDIDLSKHQNMIIDYINKQNEKTTNKKTTNKKTGENINKFLVDKRIIFESNMIKQYNIYIYQWRNKIIKYDKIFTTLTPFIFLIAALSILL
jgi:hypothetical protein